MVVGVVVIQLTSADSRAEAAGPYQEGQAVTVVVPAASLDKVEMKKNQAGVSFEVRVSLDDRGNLVLGGDPTWRSKSLPLVTTGQVTSIKTAKRAKETTLTVASDDRTISFRMPAGSPWEGPIGEVLVVGHSSVAEPSPGLTDSLNRMLDAFCSRPLAAPLDALDERIQRRIAELQVVVGAYDQPSTSTFEGKVYFAAPLGEGTVVYSSDRSSASQRASNTITDRVLPAVKAWAAVFFGRVPFDGFHFTATITHKDFSKYPPKPAYDTLEIYASLDDVEAYADDDLIGQQLIDASTVLLNGSRVRLDLAAQ